MSSRWFTSMKNNKFFRKFLAALSLFAITATSVEAARPLVKGKSATARTRLTKRLVRPKVQRTRIRRGPTAKKARAARKTAVSKQAIRKPRGRAPIRKIAVAKRTPAVLQQQIKAKQVRQAQIARQQAEALRLQREADAREQARREEERVRQEALRREREAEDELIRTNFFQVNAPAPFDEQLDQRIRHTLERMTVEQNPMPGTAPAPGSRIIRRPWADYARDNPIRSIVLCSGHTGPHGGTYGTTQGPESYMIDQCWGEVDPDAVLDMNNERQMRYIPSGVVDQIVADDPRGLENSAVISLARVLKPGGKIVFGPGRGGGWPGLEHGLARAWIDESGRYARAPQAKFRALVNPGPARDRFVQKALKKARRYYGARGYSQVDYDQGLFVLTK